MPALLSLPEYPFTCGYDEILTAAAQMDADLASVGLDFEGRALPYSTIAIGIPERAIQEVVRGGGEIHRALESLLNVFVAEHRQGFLDGPLHRLFTPFSRWWDHMSSEQRTLRPINLMRFDAIVDGTDRWTLVENNTCCPGGVITPAHVRQAWMQTKMAVAELAGRQVIANTVDDPDGFVNMLDQLLSETGNDGSIALLNHNGVYTNELGALKSRFDSLKRSGLVKSPDLIIGDIKDLKCEGEKAYIGGIEVGLIYCKLDWFSLDPADLQISGWLNTLQSQYVEQVNSLGAMFLTEAKRSIAGLFDDQIRVAIGLSAQQIAAIDRFYPRTWVASNQLALDRRNLGMERFVLKADSSNRGRGVFIATPTTSEAEWDENIQKVVRHYGVVQEKCDIPRREVPSFVTPDQLDIVMEYYGVDLFFFKGSFGGAMGRSHTAPILNVGNGGRLVPVVILKENA